MKLRRARLDDIDVLSELSFRSKQSNGYDDDFMAACREELTVTADDLKAGEYWIAETDEVCGCACLRPDPDRPKGEVHAFFIDPDHQRQGVGRLLWQKLLERARAQNLVELRLDADPFAVPFYRKLGFEIVGTMPSGSIPGREIPHMKIAIDP